MKQKPRYRGTEFWIVVTKNAEGAPQDCTRVRLLAKSRAVFTTGSAHHWEFHPRTRIR